MTRRLAFIIIMTIFLLPLYLSTGTAGENTPSFAFSLETGDSVYIGNFRDHLSRDGAYLQSPALDMSFSVFLFGNWGVQGVLANQSVIHPQSEPIEGTIHHEILELFFHKQSGRHLVKCYGGIGFQHTTMLLEYYSSGMVEAGATYGWEFLDERYVTVSAKYRRGILPSLLIKEKYGLTKADTIESVTLCIGVTKVFY